MDKAKPEGPLKIGVTLDWWSVIAALGAAALVRFNILPHIPW
jgi:hypothetical protein